MGTNHETLWTFTTLCSTTTMRTARLPHFMSGHGAVSRHLQVSLKCFESDIFSSYFKARGTLQTDKAFFQTKPFFPLTSTLNRSHGMQRSALSGCITSGGFVSSSDEHGSVAQQWSHRDLNLQTVSRSSWSAGLWPRPRHICVKMRMLSISMS